MKILVDARHTRTTWPRQFADEFAQLAASDSLERRDVLVVGLGVELVEPIEKWQRLVECALCADVEARLSAADPARKVGLHRIGARRPGRLGVAFDGCEHE